MKAQVSSYEAMDGEGFSLSRTSKYDFGYFINSVLKIVPSLFKLLVKSH